MADHSTDASDPAPAERARAARLARQLEMLAANSLVQRLMDTLPQRVLILNDSRQVVGASREFMDLLGMCDSRDLLGKRPGDVLDCIHAINKAGGCGTTDACRTCGAVTAIVASQGGAVERECQIRQSKRDAGVCLDLRVRASPLTLGDEVFTVFSVSDIGSEKRRGDLERVFFHDIANTAGCVGGYAEMMQQQIPQEFQRYAELLVRLSLRLTSEIEAQREILAAESGELSVRMQELESCAFLRHVARIYAGHRAASARDVVVSPAAHSFQFESDAALLGRVLANMVKNALEASGRGRSVTLDCRRFAERVEFSVHNDAAMSPAVQDQVFQRSFSTKGADRGLGTYSMKLLGEQYLGGAVTFESTPTSGTCFRIALAA